MKEIKACANGAFCIASIVGFIDMAAQAASYGCVRPIHSALEFATGMKSATKLPAHCVVRVTVRIEE